MAFGVDYAWGRPGVRALIGARVDFAMRYVSHDTTGKNLSRSEAQALTDAGIWIGLVWESTAQRPLDGHAAGMQDAPAADALAKACGMPAGRPLYFAADWDVQPGETDAVNAYLRGCGAVLGVHRVGLYGGYEAIRAAFDAGVITYGWQTYAWSGGRWDHRAQLHQYSNDHIIGGVGLDYDQSMTGDYGQWMIGRTPTSSTPPPQEDDDMPYGQLADGPEAITPISLPRGRYKTLGLVADNGLQKLGPAKVRVAVHSAAHGWSLTEVEVDSNKGQSVVTFAQGDVDGISVRREDEGNVHVAWEVS